MSLVSANRYRRIALSGTIGAGKSTTARALSAATGIPLTADRGVRELTTDVLGLETPRLLNPQQLLQLGMMRYAERVSAEDRMTFGFISDGTPLSQAENGAARMEIGPFGPGTEIRDPGYAFAMSAFRDMALLRTASAYTDVVHLGAPDCDYDDGCRPADRAFRLRIDDRLRSSLRSLELDSYHEVDGMVEERVDQIITRLGLERIPQGPSRTENRVTYRDIDDLLGPWDTRFFGSRFGNTGMNLYDVTIDPEARQVDAKVDLFYAAAWSTLSDGTIPTPHLSTIDAIRITGQLSQALLYTQDGVSRGEGGNLWARSLALDPGQQPIEDVSAIPVRLWTTKDYPRLRMGGAVYHSAKIEGTIGEGKSTFRVTGKVGYELPERLCQPAA